MIASVRLMVNPMQRYMQRGGKRKATLNWRWHRTVQTPGLIIERSIVALHARTALAVAATGHAIASNAMENMIVLNRLPNFILPGAESRRKATLPSA